MELSNLKTQKREENYLFGLRLAYLDLRRCDRALLRRLFSTFAQGWPGVGLLLLRLIAAIAVIAQSLTTGSVLLDGLAIAAGILLLSGLWTPVSGSLLAVLELWKVFSRQPRDPWADILLGTIGAALALLGPGAWSVDARLFGWKRIDLRDRQS